MYKVSIGACFLLSAFLIFWVQPMLGKALLPTFGGTPMVWSTALLFFQVLLLAGYAYSHWLVSRLSLRVQINTHRGMALVSLAVLVAAWAFGDGPLIPSSVEADAGSPVRSILVALAVSVGLPYLFLSGTSSLLQSWAGRVAPDRSPYRYYALSNGGSLLALLLFPVAIEVLLPLGAQARLWAVAFFVFVALITAVSLEVARRIGESDAPTKPRRDAEKPKTEVRRRDALLWILLSACASEMLLATTNQISQDIAVVPFLWIVPLVLYLLTFILCFGSDRAYGRWMVPVLFAATLLHGGVLIQREHLHILTQLAAHGFVLFVTAMVCHGELVRARPSEAHLTRFYLAVAFGGALGGLFTVFVAPRIFTLLYDVTFGLAATWVVIGIAWMADRRSPMYHRRFSRGASLVIALALTSLAAITMVYIRSLQGATLEARRGFFGTLSVSYAAASTRDTPIFELAHGLTAHGIQIATSSGRGTPTAYYGRESGVGRILEHYPRGDAGLSVGVVGLGIGTIAAFGQEGDRYRFYEINPDVIDYARGAGGYFSFLDDSRADISIIEGDARVSLRREALETAEAADILILDAFLGHAVPVHLLTEEAFALYLKRLRSTGAILVHIGNPYLDLEPQLALIGKRFGLKTARFQTRGDGRTTYDAVWVALTRQAPLLERPGIAPYVRRLRTPGEEVSLWTDSYSNLLQALR